MENRPCTLSVAVNACWWIKCFYSTWKQNPSQILQKVIHVWYSWALNLSTHSLPWAISCSHSGLMFAPPCSIIYITFIYVKTRCWTWPWDCVSLILLQNCKVINILAIDSTSINVHLLVQQFSYPCIVISLTELVTYITALETVLDTPNRGSPACTAWTLLLVLLLVHHWSLSYEVLQLLQPINIMC